MRRLISTRRWRPVRGQRCCLMTTMMIATELLRQTPTLPISSVPIFRKFLCTSNDRQNAKVFFYQGRKYFGLHSMTVVRYRLDYRCKDAEESWRVMTLKEILAPLSRFSLCHLENANHDTKKGKNKVRSCIMRIFDRIGFRHALNL